MVVMSWYSRDRGRKYKKGSRGPLGGGDSHGRKLSCRSGFKRRRFGWEDGERHGEKGGGGSIGKGDSETEKLGGVLRHP